MDRAMPDERAHRSQDGLPSDRAGPEHRRGTNAEIRKDVLKYDEVMNEQRKVIYARRQQVIDGEDIHDATIGSSKRCSPTSSRSVSRVRSPRSGTSPVCSTSYRSTTPMALSADALAVYENIDDVIAVIVDEAVANYEKKCEEFPGGIETAKEIERDVMLQILDQRGARTCRTWTTYVTDPSTPDRQYRPTHGVAKRGLPHVRAAARSGRHRLRALHHPREAQFEPAPGDEGLERASTNAEQVARAARNFPRTARRASQAAEAHPQTG